MRASHVTPRAVGNVRILRFSILITGTGERLQAAAAVEPPGQNTEGRKERSEKNSRTEKHAVYVDDIAFLNVNTAALANDMTPRPMT